MKIEDYKEGIYINKNGEDIVEIVYKTTDDNIPQFISDEFHRYMISIYATRKRSYSYFMKNYVFCCEF